MPSGFMQRFKGKTFTPTGSLTQFGAGGANSGESGNINVQVSSAGISPAAIGADKVLAVYALPASSLDLANRVLQIIAAGSFAANGNTKRVKIIYGATAAVVGQTVTGGIAIADTGAVVTSGGGWQLAATVAKYGNNGSNTQLAVHNQAQVGGAVSPLVAPQLVTAPENAPILIAVTGNSTTTAADIVFNFLEVSGSN
jgi:hypothetical protein